MTDNCAGRTEIDHRTVEERMMICALCNKAEAFKDCDGCKMPMCEKCACQVVKKSGYGCVWSLFYCEECISDPTKNQDALR